MFQGLVIIKAKIGGKYSHNSCLTKVSYQTDPLCQVKLKCLKQLNLSTINYLKLNVSGYGALTELSKKALEYQKSKKPIKLYETKEMKEFERKTVSSSASVSLSEPKAYTTT